MIRLKPTLKFFIIKSPIFFKTFNLKPNLTNCNKLCYEFGLFKKSWRDKQHAITQQIKKTTSSEELMQIIKKKGLMMNLVHLTAILDRMQESQMINTHQIVSFTVYRIKDFEDVFKFTQSNWIRTICNIVCYLGNIKNTGLNYLFKMVNYSQVLAKSKNIQKTMVITGLIRLNLFNEVFSLSQSKDNKNKISFEDVLSNNFKLNQILSIWFAIVNSTQIYLNSSLHSVFQSLINQSGRQMVLSYREYTYAIVCYTHTYSQLKNPLSGKIYELVYYEIPRNVSKQQYLPPHQLSLLLYAISRLTKKQNRNIKEEILQKIKFYKFQRALVSNFHQIMVKKYATLRHIANNFKILNQIFKLDEQIVFEALHKMLTLLKEEKQLIIKSQSYKMNNKIDSLSICSLVWKINDYFYSKRFHFKQKELINQFNVRITQFLIQIQRKSIFSHFTVQQLLMLYSGFFSAAHITQINFSQQFKSISQRVILNTVRKLTLKQYTLFYTYLKKTQLFSPLVCRFIKENVNEICQINHVNNKTALKIAQQNTCIMDRKQNCLGCLSKPTLKDQETIQ